MVGFPHKPFGYLIFSVKLQLLTGRFTSFFPRHTLINVLC